MGHFAVFLRTHYVGQAAVCCYHGIWTLRKCSVLQDYRGHGLQRRLIRARLRYVKGRGGKRVTAWVDPLRGSYSLNNLIAEGFTFMHKPSRAFDGIEHVGLHKRL